MAYKNPEDRRAAQRAWYVKNREHRRAYMNRYDTARRAEQRNAKYYLDDVVVDELASGQFWGRASLHERRAAADICFVRGFGIAETARRLGVHEVTVKRYKARWEASRVDTVADR